MEWQKAVDPGTAVFSYAVGLDKTRLLQVVPSGAPSLRIITIPSSEEALRRDVESRLRLSIMWRRPTDDKALTALGTSLDHALIRPAEPFIGTADRVLVIGDGPLLHAAVLRADPLGSA